MLALHTYTREVLIVFRSPRYFPQGDSTRFIYLRGKLLQRVRFFVKGDRHCEDEVIRRFFEMRILGELLSSTKTATIKCAPLDAFFFSFSLRD